MRANFFLIYFLIFIRSEARTLLEKHGQKKVVESGYGREPVPLPPTPESASPSNQERLKRQAHRPPPAPKHDPKIDQVRSSRHGRESSELLMAITSNIISDNELLILLPSISSDNQERFGKHSHLPPPAPKPADEQGQIIVTSSNCQDVHMNSNYIGREERILPPPTPKPADEEGQIIITSSSTTNDDQNSNYMGREGRILPPPSPHHDAPIGQLSSRRHGRSEGLKPHKYPISSLPLQASYLILSY